MSKWNIEVPELGSDAPYIITDEEGLLVATVPNTGDRERDYGNAALVAVAPELYAAVETTVRKVKCHDAIALDVCENYEEETRECRKFGGKCPIQKWEDLLAKARGEVAK